MVCAEILKKCPSPQQFSISRIKKVLILKSRFHFHVAYSINWHSSKNLQIRSFFWSAFSRIWTEYGHFLRKSPSSVRIWENTDQKKLHIWTLFTMCEINVLFSLSMPLLKYLYKDQPISWNLLLVMAWNTFWAILL